MSTMAARPVNALRRRFGAGARGSPLRAQPPRSQLEAPVLFTPSPCMSALAPSCASPGSVHGARGRAVEALSSLMREPRGRVGSGVALTSGLLRAALQ
jgi:hypothetical protein